MLAVTVALALAGVSLTVGAAPAYAHNTFVGSDPADASTVAQTPGTVVLTFDEPAIALGTKVVVTGPAGTEVELGAPRLVDNTVSQDLQPGSPAGRYTVEWRVTSADGHPISGRFGFTSQAMGSGTPAPATATTPPATAEASPGASAVTGPAVGLIAGLALVGVVLAVVTVFTRRRHRVQS